MDQQYFYNKIDNIKNTTIDFAPTLITSILILILFFSIADYYKKYFINPEEIKSNNSLASYSIKYILYYIIIFVGIIFFSYNIGVNIATLVTILGTLGFAIGLAMQNSLQNIISGIVISSFNLFNIGDVIKISGLSNINSLISGKVINFNLAYTTISDLTTNVLTIIPNTIVYSNILSNIKPS
jgi:small conductance mechanosensitive channel